MTSAEPGTDGKGSDAGGTKDKSKNTAPDAVRDPNEKTDGKPGLPPGADQGDDADPGGG